jgi:hypothetical protein
MLKITLDHKRPVTGGLMSRVRDNSNGSFEEITSGDYSAIRTQNPNIDRCAKGLTPLQTQNIREATV